MKKIDFFMRLEHAVRANICSPTPEEEEGLADYRKIKASGYFEGDSQIGTTLFIGIASLDFGFDTNSICSFLSIERKEFNYKVHKFVKKLETQNAKYLAKIKMIKKHLELNGIKE